VDNWISSAPIVADGVAYVNNVDYDTLIALDAATGDERWRFATGSVEAAQAVVDRVVYIGATLNDGMNGAVYSLDAATGKEIWRFATPLPIYGSSPAVVDGVVYAGSFSGEIVAVNAVDGEEQWRVKVDLEGDAGRRHILSSPAVVDGVIYFTSYDSDADQALAPSMPSGCPSSDDAREDRD
jgi:outer membrane protein assembly factor BamB